MQEGRMFSFLMVFQVTLLTRPDISTALAVLSYSTFKNVCICVTVALWRPYSYRLYTWYSCALCTGFPSSAPPAVPYGSEKVPYGRAECVL